MSQEKSSKVKALLLKIVQQIEEQNRRLFDASEQLLQLKTRCEALWEDSAPRLNTEQMISFLNTELEERQQNVRTLNVSIEDERRKLRRLRVREPLARPYFALYRIARKLRRPFGERDHD